MLENKNNTIVKSIILVVSTVFLFGFIVLMRETLQLTKDEIYISATLFSFIFAFSLILFLFNKKIDLYSFGFLTFTLGALIFLRTSLLYFESGDYTTYLSKWVFTMKNLPFSDALSLEIGDYNLPYMYFLAIISRFKLSSLILIKAFSCFFEVITAFLVMKIVSLKVKSIHWQILSFVLVIVAPTVIFNSAFWGQCDIIYTALCLLSMYFALKDRGLLSVIFFTLAFTFKIQSIFILPALIVCLIIGKIKPIHLTIIPLIFFITAIPALIFGRSVESIINIFNTQVTEYPHLVLNAPSIYRFIGNVKYDDFKVFAIFLAGAVALIFLYIFYFYRESINKENLINIFFISALLIPYFLPCMHERYFFIADVLSIIVFFYNKRKFYVPITVIFASLVSYEYYLFRQFVLFDQRLTSLALLIVLVIELKSLIFELTSKCKDNSYAKQEIIDI